METEIGKIFWVIPGGHIPLKSTGKQPEFVSQDKVSVLNTTRHNAEISMQIYFTDPEREPAGPYKLKIDAKRMRSFRMNDLIDPHAIPLDEDYAFTLRASVPVVVQFSRMDTGAAEAAIMGTVAYAEKDES